MTDKDFSANLNNLGAAISGFAQVIGAPAIPNAIAGLHLLTDAVHCITNQAAEHPTVANAIATGVTPLIWGAAHNALKDIYNHLPSMSGTQAAAHTPFATSLADDRALRLHATARACRQRDAGHSPASDRARECLSG